MAYLADKINSNLHAEIYAKTYDNETISFQTI